MNIPTHVAIIPDGNRRWARAHMLRAWQGHERGVKTFRTVVGEAYKLDITHLTFWAASESNLTKRSEDEVRHLVRLLRELLKDRDLKKQLREHRARLRFLGRWDEILEDPALSESIHDIEEETSQFHDRHLTILFGYDGRTEMVDAVRSILREHRGEVTTDTIKQFLWTYYLPPVDLVIRTGEEEEGWAHLSAGFMMWDTADARFYFTKTYWPDFSADELRRVIERYAEETRRFGA